MNNNIETKCVDKSKDFYKIKKLKNYKLNFLS